VAIDLEHVLLDPPLIAHKVSVYVLHVPLRKISKQVAIDLEHVLFDPPMIAHQVSMCVLLYMLSLSLHRGAYSSQGNKF